MVVYLEREIVSGEPIEQRKENHGGQGTFLFVNALPAPRMFHFLRTKRPDCLKGEEKAEEGRNGKITRVLSNVSHPAA